MENSLLISKSSITSVEDYVYKGEHLPFITATKNSNVRYELVNQYLRDGTKVIIHSPSNGEPVVSINCTAHRIYMLKELTNYLFTQYSYKGDCFIDRHENDTESHVGGLLANSSICIKNSMDEKTTIPCIQVDNRIVLNENEYEALTQEQKSLFYRFVVSVDLHPLILSTNKDLFVEDDLSVEFGYLISPVE